MHSIHLAKCISLFNEDFAVIDNAVRELRSYRIEVHPGVYHSLNNRSIESFVCLQFLRMHLSWEEFLESTFIRYICGYSSPSGLTPKLLCAQQRCLKDAMTEIHGTRRYVNWAPTETVDRACKYLDGGEPYHSSISAAKHELQNIYSIRNRIAHRSDFAKEQFRDVIRSEIGYNPRGITPGRFLLIRKKIGRRKNVTYLEYYMEMLSILSRQIVP
jgi:hypothetical protein